MRRTGASSVDMSKYAPLAEYLGKQETGRVTLTFGQVEEILGAQLPASARCYRPWWGNEIAGQHVQARAWLDVGWRLESVSH